MDDRFEVTLTDSTMMWIVHCAMNKAQEKMKTKKGVIERLNEISKFYELAVMQLEGCLSFVEAETDRSNFLDTNHEEVLADLREIKERLQGRLRESEMAISKKDKELTERLENELKLRQALELKEGEIVSLGVNIKELEKTRRKSEDGDGEFCEMKTCVDQQMLNINESLEPHGEVPHCGIDSKKVEEMGSDIDILKQTLDIAFGKIQNAFFFGDMGPREQQWKLTTEKHIMSILVKSYLREFQENIEAKVRMQGKQVLKHWLEHWPQLMNEVTNLRHELGSLITQNELLGTYTEDFNNNTSPLSSQEHIWHKISQEMARKPALEKSGQDKSKRSLEKKERLPKEEGNEDGSNFVANMVKKHQSIIRQKSEELNISKLGALLQEKRASPTKKEKDLDRMKERIQNIIAKLDNLINWNSKVSESLFDQRVIHDETDEVKKDEYTLEGSWEKMKGIFSSSNEEWDVKSVSNKEKNDNILEDKFLEKGMVEEIQWESFNLDIEKQIEEGICKFYLKEVVNEWNECIERNNIETHIKEEVYFIVFSETSKHITNSTQDFVLAKCVSDKVDEIENTIREDVGMLVFKEMVEEYNKILEDYNSSMEYRMDKIRDYFLDHLQLVRTKSLLKEDLCEVVLRGMLREWKVELDNYYLENLLKDQLHQFIMVETMKDAIILSMEVKPLVQDKTMEEVAFFNTMLNQLHEVQSKEKLIKILLQSLLACFEAEESLMLSARSEIKEHSRQLDLGSERGELHEHEIFEDLLIREEQTFSSLTTKVENALQQLSISKALLSELGTTLSLRQCYSKKYNQTITENGQLKPSHSNVLPLLNFLQTFTEFEGIVNQKLKTVTMRLENMKHCLDPVVEMVIFLRSKESIFHKAFTRRCQNLQKAELEVDLLGDQVDALLTLLEKIYVTLYQYAPVLQQYFGVSNMLELIKKELTNGAI